jgi:hypothetical protein
MDNGLLVAKPVSNYSIPMFEGLDEKAFFGLTSTVLRVAMVCKFGSVMGIFHPLT